MRCYNCGCELSEHSFCTNCGVEVALYKKIIRTSNYFYNQGLERAKVRDLSGAIVSLRESLKFNKNNIKARNLLGLVYFELGEVPAALSEWVISKNLKGKKNIASDYLNLVQSNPAKLDAINQSIKKYNIALEACGKSDGVDLAVIQLKALLKTNPKFVRAHQLLALCFIKQRKLEFARRELEKCRAIDVNNTMTLRYLAEVDAMVAAAESSKKKKSGVQEEVARTYTADNSFNIEPKPIIEKRGSNTVLNIIFGIAIGFAITFFLVLPARVQQEKAEALENVKVISTQLDAKNLTITELEQKNSEQNEKIAALAESLSAYAGTEGTLLSMENLLKAAAIYLENNESYLEVADYIKEVDELTWTENTSENYKNLYYALKAAIGERVCDAYYAEGISAINNEQLNDAIAYLEAAVFFDAADRDALYQLAIVYAALNRTDDAKATYSKVVELFPDTWYATKASQALEKIQ